MILRSSFRSGGWCPSSSSPLCIDGLGGLGCSGRSGSGAQAAANAIADPADFYADPTDFAACCWRLGLRGVEASMAGWVQAGDAEEARTRNLIRDRVTDAPPAATHDYTQQPIEVSLVVV